MADLPTKVSDRIRQLRTVQRAKSHLQRNKKYYVTGASCIAVGALSAMAYSGRSDVKIRIKGDGNNVVGKAKHVTMVKAELERRGHPGNVVICLDTGEVFASQNRAASSTGVSPSVLSKHLSGKIPDAKGLKFQNLGEAV